MDRPDVACREYRPLFAAVAVNGHPFGHRRPAWSDDSRAGVRMHEETYGAERRVLPEEGRALLVGDWPPAWVRAIARRYAVLRAEGGEGGDTSTAVPADWLLIGPGTDPGLLRRMPPTSRRARMAATGEAPPTTRDCDVRVPATACPADLLTALRLAEEGFAVGGRTAGPPAAPAHRLTGREIELLGVLGDGLGNDQIARALNISRRTVEFHLTRIFRKLGVASRMEAIVRAQRIGVIG
jgi:DNA-binding CsgD family transcriptional regulator